MPVPLRFVLGCDPLGGSLPNHGFADALGLPTVRVPHSFPAGSRHAPNEHLPGSVAREGLAVMTGAFRSLGAPPPHVH